MEATKTQSLAQIFNCSEYEINICGKCMDIQTLNTKYLYLLFKDGGGYGGGRDYSGYANYYVVESSNFGKELKVIGSGYESMDAYSCKSKLVINGVEHSFPFPLDNMMKKIMKKKTN